MTTWLMDAVQVGQRSTSDRTAHTRSAGAATGKVTSVCMVVCLAVDPRCHTLRLPSDGHGDERANARPTGPRALSRCATPWPRPRVASRLRRSPSWCRPTTSAWPPGASCPRARSARSPTAGVGLAAVVVPHHLPAGRAARRPRPRRAGPPAGVHPRAGGRGARRAGGATRPVRPGRRATRPRNRPWCPPTASCATSAPAGLDALAACSARARRGRAHPPRPLAPGSRSSWYDEQDLAARGQRRRARARGAELGSVVSTSRNG